MFYFSCLRVTPLFRLASFFVLKTVHAFQIFFRAIPLFLNEIHFFCKYIEIIFQKFKPILFNYIFM